MSDLDARLRAAHAARDRHSLVTLYREGADTAASADAAYFFLTQAYVFALETDHPEAAALRERLAAGGREESPAKR